MRTLTSRAAIAATVLALVAGTATTLQPAATAASKAPLTRAPKVQVERSVGGHSFVPAARKLPGASADGAGYRPRTELPRPTTARSVALPEVASRRVEAGSVPVALGAVRSQDGLARSVDAANVRVLPQTAARAAGVDGALFEISVPPAERSAPSARAALAAGDLEVPVTVDYSSFRDLYGGDWASRLRLTVVHECAVVTTRDGSSCPDDIPLPTTNDPGRTLKAMVPLSAAGTVLLAAEAAPAGPSGDFGATDLQASSAWSVGQQSGGFSWSYPVPTVPVPSDLTPEVAVTYSSQSVDGRTQASNNQTSWLGEGQSLESGFIERSYASCADSQSAGKKTGDLCWKNDNATLSFSGESGTLIHIPGTNQWRAQNDEGWRIRKLTDTSPGNGDNDGEYWELTDQDGTRYYFGKERRFAGDTASTESAWTAPVFGDDAGEPCHAATFAGSWCQQAWRWNLDYVVDLHGNTISYSYNSETNHYGLNDNASQPSYVRGGYLTRIDYGQVAGTENTAAAPARVVFDTAERCLPETGFDCDPAKLTAANASRWPDVPFDQICDDQASCRDHTSPTFFSRKRLTSIRTQVRTGADSYRNVDAFDFDQSFPAAGDGTGRSMWLQSITRRGLDGGTAAVNPVTFTGVQLDNRVLTDGAAPLIKWRLKAIKTETGGTINVNYAAAQCTPSNVPAKPAGNTMRCFPVYWQQVDGVPPTLNWFHKYVVGSVVQADVNGTVPPMTTSYSYLGGAAWHYDDNELVKPKYRTYGGWRGFGSVEVRTGTGAEASYDKYTYLRGMSANPLPDGSRPAVTVDDSQGTTYPDHDVLAGYLLEHIQRDGEAGTVVSAEINTPWRSEATADDGDQEAHIVRTKSVQTRRQKVGTSTYVRNTVSTDYDSYGLPTSVEDDGDTAKTGDSSCARSWYARDTDSWLLTPVARTQLVDLDCTATPADADVLSSQRFAYDRGGYGDAPTKGDLTGEETLSGTPGNSSWKVTSTLGYDARGRVTTTTDGLGNTSKTQYTPTGEGTDQLGPVTRQTETNAKNQKTVTDLNPSRGLPTSVTDPNNHVTSVTYDPVGRTTAVWKDGHVQGTDKPQLRFDYQISNSTYSWQSTQTLLKDESYATSYTIYDAALRAVETQEPVMDYSKGRVITTTTYNSRGEQAEVYGPYTNAGSTPTGTFYSPSPVQVANDHRYLYDGAGRQTGDIYEPLGLVKWRATTTYDADRTLTDPPEGGTPTTEVFDVHGNTVQTIQHWGTTTAATSLRTTSYTYDAAGQLQSMTDPGGDLWKWTYDLRGNQTQAKDPDHGTTTTTYNNNDQAVTTTDARGIATTAAYDPLGRQIARYDGKTADDDKLRASWVYDTLAAGQLTSATRYQTPGDPSTKFVEEVTGYEIHDQPIGTKTTIPSIPGLTDSLAGTYTTSMTYNDTGTLQNKRLPAAGDLPAETVHSDYDLMGQPIGMGGKDSILGDVTYSPYGEMLQVSTGTKAGYLAFQTRFYDEGTRRLTRDIVSDEAVGPYLSNTTYGYDQAGNVTSAKDTGPTTDIQCFDYNYLRQLTQAWTIDKGSCATPSQSVMGTAVGAYWKTYSYDPLGDRKTMVNHVKTGAAKNTKTTYAYPAAGPTTYPSTTTGVGGPHALSSTAKQVGTGTVTATKYAYDAAGNMTTRGAQTLTWGAEGELKTIKTAAGTGTNVYDADGNRILRRDPDGVTTLYLDSTEIQLSGTTKTAQRWYTFNGQVVMTRTAAGVSMLAADPHGTGQVQINSTTAAYSKRRFDPFGNTRTGAGKAIWLGDHTFLDKPRDDTGLTQIGARSYDATLGRFISVDPLLAVDDPLQHNGYQYARNNPVTDSDPTGTQILPGAPVEQAHNHPNPVSHGSPASGGYGYSPQLQSIQNNVSRVRSAERDLAQGRVNPWLLSTEGQFWSAYNQMTYGPPVDLGPTPSLLDAADFIVPIHACGDEFSVTGCGIGLAMVLPPGKALKGLRFGEEALRGATAAERAASAGGRALPSGPKIAASWGADTYRHGGLMSTIEHINYRHAYGSGFSGVSRYSEDTSVGDIKGYVGDVLRNGSVTDRGMVGDVGRIIGTDAGGNPVTGLEVIVRAGMIKSAFPVAAP